MKPVSHLLKGRLSRRGLLKLSGVAAAGALIGVRVSGYHGFDTWNGRVLARWEALVVAAFAEALLPDEPGGPLAVSLREIVEHIDRMLAGMPPSLRLEVHGLIALLEHGSPGGGHLSRATRLDPAERLDLLHRLAGAPWPLPAAWRGIRDLCALALWQDPRSWAEIGYEGPMVDRVSGPAGRYSGLVAQDGALPRGIRG